MKLGFHIDTLTWHVDIWRPRWTWVHPQTFITALEPQQGLCCGADHQPRPKGLSYLQAQAARTRPPPLQLELWHLTTWYCQVIILHVLSLSLLLTRLIIGKSSAALKVISTQIKIPACSHSLQHVSEAPCGRLHTCRDPNKISLGHGVCWEILSPFWVFNLTSEDDLNTNKHL